MVNHRETSGRIGDGLLLGLDTSTRSMTVSLWKQGLELAESHSIAERNHSIQLMPAIRDLLREYGFRPADLQAIAVGVGPGSYTGVRIGVTVAKTMAWSLGVPVVGVSSLQALARGAAREAGSAAGIGGSAEGAVRWYVPLMDARRGQVYTALYACGPSGAWVTISADAIRLMSEWMDELQTMLAQKGRGVEAAGSEAAPESGGFLAADFTPPEELVLVGDIDACPPFADTFASRFGVRLRLERREISAADIAGLGRARLLRGERDETHGLAPNYTQLAEAETKLLAKERQGGEGHGGAC